MATEDEVRRLILEVVGEEKVRSLKEQIEKERESLVNLTNALSGMTAEQLAADKRVQLATQTLANLNKELRNTQGTQREFGMAAVEASRAIEDLQFGFNGVVNNIPGLTAALAKAAGLTVTNIAGITAAVSLLAVGINQLIKHKDDILAFFTNKPVLEFGDAVNSAKKVVDELSKKEIKTVFDVQAIEGAKALAEWMERAQKASESFRGLKTEAEEAAGKAAKEAIAEVPGGAGALQARMVEMVTQQNIAQSARLRMLQEEVRFQEAKIPGLPGGVAGRDFQQVVKPLIDAAKEGIIGIQTEARRQAERTVGEAFRGAVAGEAAGRGRFAALARGAGAGALAEQILRTTPEAIEQREIRKQQADLEKQQQKWSENLDKAKRDASDAEMRAINEKIRIEEREAEQAQRAAEKQQHQAEQDQRKAEALAERRGHHEAELLRRSFGEQNISAAQMALGQGMSEDQVRGMMVKAFQQAGASRRGAEIAATQQMEQALVDVGKNGGLAAALVNRQSKLMRQFQREQAEHRRLLEDSWRRTNQIQDNASRRGR